MKSLIATATSLALMAIVSHGNEAAAQAQKSQAVTRAGSQPSAKGPAEYFTGNVRVDPLFPANESAPYSGALRDVRAGRAVELAYASDGSAPDRHSRRGPYPGVGWTDRRSACG